MMEKTSMTAKTGKTAVLTVLLIVTLQPWAHGIPDGPWRAGYRVELLTADGKPANDMMGSGAFLRYMSSDQYEVELAFEYVEYDFESPEHYLGFRGSGGDDTDSRTRLTLISLRIERAWLAEHSLRPIAFVGLGIGYAVVDDMRGTADGEVYDINAEGGLETVPGCGVGLQYDHEHWTVAGGLKVEHHFAQWELEDRVTGRTAEISDYTSWGLWTGLSMLF